MQNADDGIAYLAMPNRQDRQEIRDGIAELAEYVAARMGLPQPANLLVAAE